MNTLLNILFFMLINFSVSNDAEWVGNWSYIPANTYDYYSLTIGDKINDQYTCTLEVTGNQTYYEIECKTAENNSSLNIYFWSVNSGVFNEDIIDRAKPIISLKLENGKTLTNWYQVFSYNTSETVCFEKQ